MPKARILTMANANDDDLENLMSFVRSVARLQLYFEENGELGEVQEHHGEDAMEALNSVIEEARGIIGHKPEPA